MFVWAELVLILCIGVFPDSEQAVGGKEEGDERVRGDPLREGADRVPVRQADGRPLRVQTHLPPPDVPFLPFLSIIGSLRNLQRL